MPRKGSVSKRKIQQDPKFKDDMVSKFINSLMYDGKKSKAEKIFYKALEMVRDKMGKDSLEVFHSAMENVKPVLEVRPRRVGGATYQVPMEVNHFRRLSLSIRWVINASRSRQGNSMEEKLAGEIMDAAQGRGGAMKKKEDAYRMAVANRELAHYRW
jgi:small subunit ribosomal protein S7